MSKIGEGGQAAEKPSLDRYHQELEKSSNKFMRALEKYPDASGEERSHLKDVMDHQLQAINSAVRELKRAGVHKQDVKVENNYKAYIQDDNSENYAALKHDIDTLRLYNELP